MQWKGVIRTLASWVITESKALIAALGSLHALPPNPHFITHNPLSSQASAAGGPAGVTNR